MIDFEAVVYSRMRFRFLVETELRLIFICVCVNKRKRSGAFEFFGVSVAADARTEPLQDRVYLENVVAEETRVFWEYSIWTDLPTM